MREEGKRITAQLSRRLTGTTRTMEHGDGKRWAWIEERAGEAMMREGCSRQPTPRYRELQNEGGIQTSAKNFLAASSLLSGVKVERNEVERNCSLWGGGDYGRILWRCGSTRLVFHIYNNLRGVVISRSCGSIDPCSYGEKNTPADVCCCGSFRRRGDLHGGVRKPLLLTTPCHVAIGTMNRDGTRRRWDIPNAFTVLELTHGTRAAGRRYRQALIRAADHRSAPREKGQG